MLPAKAARLVSARLHPPQRWLIRTALLAVLQGMVLVGPTPRAAADSPALSIVEGADANSWGYSPASVTLAAGQALTWTNTGQLPHTATADDGAWDTGVVAPSGAAAVTFSSPGTYSYHCALHPWMKATVVVTASAQDDTPPSGDAPPAQQN